MTSVKWNAPENQTAKLHSSRKIMQPDVVTSISLITDPVLARLTLSELIS